MKMGVGTRIVFTVFMLVVLCLLLLVAATAFDLFDEASVEATVNYFAYGSLRYLWAACAVILAVIAVALIFFGIRKKEADSVILTAGEGGSVVITLEAMEEVTRRYLSEVKGIDTKKIGIKTIGPGCIRVNLALSVQKDIVIPEVTQGITEGLKYYVEKFTGIEAGYIGIRIIAQKQKQQIVKQGI